MLNPSEFSRLLHIQEGAAPLLLLPKNGYPGFLHLVSSEALFFISSACFDASLPGRSYVSNAFDAGNVYCTVVPPSGVRSASVSTLLLPQITCPPPPPLYFRTFPPPFLGDFRLPSSVKDEQDRILGHATNEEDEEEEVK